MSEVKPTVLVSAYDGPVVRLLDMVLKGRGYDTILTEHADQATPRIPEAQLVISDVSNGVYQLYNEVRKYDPKMPFIVMNGGFFEKEKAPGAIVIEKPFSPKDLAELVNTHFPQHLKPTQTPPTA